MLSISSTGMSTSFLDAPHGIVLLLMWLTPAGTMSDLGTSVQSEQVSLPLVASSPITLQIGERRFITTSETLSQGSHFFAALLSGRWDNSQADGSYFIDADPELFVHILRYLRRGVLPIFYDNTKGHDYALYLALFEEARYFQIPRLEKWLHDKGYLQAIKISYLAIELGEISALPVTRNTDEQLEHHHTWQTRKVYICPRGVAVHRGNRDRCGRQCRNAQGTDDVYEEEHFLRTIVIQKQTFVSGEVHTGG